MESSYHWLVTVGLVTSSVIAVTANVFLLIIFARKRGLRTIPNRFVINLLITNLLSSVLLIPLLLADQERSPSSLSTTSQYNQTIEEGVIIQEEIFNTPQNIQIIETSEKFLTESSRNNYSNVSENTENAAHQELLCYVAQAGTSFVCTASIFSILLIGVNQYFGVIHSLRYHFYITKRKSTVLILSSWLISLACGTLSTATYSDSSLWSFCSTRGTENTVARTLNTWYAFSYFFLVILLPFVCICIIYLCIYAAAHQNSERMRKSTSASSTTPLDVIHIESSERHESKERSTLPKVHSAPNFSILGNSEYSNVMNETSISEITSVKRTSSDKNNFITNLKHKISNASAFRYREETRAAKISIIVILMVLVCYVPYGLNLVLTSGCIRVNSGKLFNYISLVLLVFSNVISPFLFGYRNKRVKREIGKVLGLVPPRIPELPKIEIYKRQSSIIRNRSLEEIPNSAENSNNPLIDGGIVVPEVIVTCKNETDRKGILARVGSGWNNYKKCNFITVPESCLSEARGSFSSTSTQVSNDE